MGSNLTREHYDHFNRCSQINSWEFQDLIDNPQAVTRLSGLEKYYVIQRVVSKYLNTSSFNIKDEETQKLCNLSLSFLDHPDKWGELSFDDQWTLLRLSSVAHQNFNHINEMEKSKWKEIGFMSEVVKTISTFLGLSRPVFRITAAAAQGISLIANISKERYPNEKSVEDELQSLHPDFLHKFAHLIINDPKIKLSDGAKHFLDDIRLKNLESKLEEEEELDSILKEVEDTFTKVKENVEAERKYEKSSLAEDQRQQQAYNIASRIYSVVRGAFTLFQTEENRKQLAESLQNKLHDDYCYFDLSQFNHKQTLRQMQGIIKPQLYQNRLNQFGKQEKWLQEVIDSVPKLKKYLKDNECAIGKLNSRNKELRKQELRAIKKISTKRYSDVIKWAGLLGSTLKGYPLISLFAEGVVFIEEMRNEIRAKKYTSKAENYNREVARNQALIDSHYNQLSSTQSKLNETFSILLNNEAFIEPKKFIEELKEIQTQSEKNYETIKNDIKQKEQKIGTLTKEINKRKKDGHHKYTTVERTAKEGEISILQHEIEVLTKNKSEYEDDDGNYKKDPTIPLKEATLSSNEYLHNLRKSRYDAENKGLDNIDQEKRQLLLRCFAEIDNAIVADQQPYHDFCSQAHTLISFLPLLSEKKTEGLKKIVGAAQHGVSLYYLYDSLIKKLGALAVSAVAQTKKDDMGGEVAHNNQPDFLSILNVIPTLLTKGEFIQTLVNPSLRMVVTTISLINLFFGRKEGERIELVQKSVNGLEELISEFIKKSEMNQQHSHQELSVKLDEVSSKIEVVSFAVLSRAVDDKISQILSLKETFIAHKKFDSPEKDYFIEFLGQLKVIADSANLKSYSGLREEQEAFKASPEELPYLFGKISHDYFLLCGHQFSKWTPNFHILRATVGGLSELIERFKASLNNSKQYEETLSKDEVQKNLHLICANFKRLKSQISYFKNFELVLKNLTGVISSVYRSLYEIMHQQVSEKLKDIRKTIESGNQKQDLSELKKSALLLSSINSLPSTNIHLRIFTSPLGLTVTSRKRKESDNKIINNYFSELENLPENLEKILPEDPASFPLPLLINKNYMNLINQNPCIMKLYDFEKYGLGVISTSYSCAFEPDKGMLSLKLNYKCKIGNEELNLAEAKIIEVISENFITYFKDMKVCDNIAGLTRFIVAVMEGFDTYETVEDHWLLFTHKTEGPPVSQPGLLFLQNKLSRFNVPYKLTLDLNKDSSRGCFGDIMKWAQSDSTNITEGLLPFFSEFKIEYSEGYLQALGKNSLGDEIIYNHLIHDPNYETLIKKYRDSYSTLVSAMCLVGNIDNESAVLKLQKEMNFVSPEIFGCKSKENVFAFMREMEERMNISSYGRSIINLSRFMASIPSQFIMEAEKLERSIDSIFESIKPNIQEEDEIESLKKKHELELSEFRNTISRDSLETLKTTEEFKKQTQNNLIDKNKFDTFVCGSSTFKKLPTVGDGACALHALLGEFTYRVYFCEKAREKFVSKFKQQFEEIKPNWIAFMISGLKDYLSSQEASPEVKKIFSQIDIRAHRKLIEQRQVLDAEFKKYSLMQELCFEYLVTDPDLLESLCSFFKLSPKIRIQLVNESDYRNSFFRKNFDQIREILVKEYEYDFLREFHNFLQTFNYALELCYTTFIEENFSQLQEAYLKASSEKDYYFTNDEIQMAAILFRKNVKIYSKILSTVEEVLHEARYEGEVMHIYHGENHYSRCRLT